MKGKKLYLTENEILWLQAVATNLNDWEEGDGKRGMSALKTQKQVDNLRKKIMDL